MQRHSHPKRKEYSLLMYVELFLSHVSGMLTDVALKLSTVLPFIQTSATKHPEYMREHVDIIKEGPIDDLLRVLLLRFFLPYEADFITPFNPISLSIPALESSQESNGGRISTKEPLSQ
jgi:hypothetical protein